MRACHGLPLALFLSSLVRAHPASVGYEKRVVLGVPVHVITANLKDPSVKVSVLLASGFPGGTEPFASMVQRTDAVAAVTGTFFSTLSLLPVGDLVIDGSLRYFGGFGAALAVTPDNNPTFRMIPFGRHVDWRPFETVISCGPRLVRNGRVSVSPRAEGFTDPHVLSRARRVAVGVTAGRKLRLMAVTRPLTLTETAKIMHRLGCLESINLDGGSSTAMYYRGRIVIAPSRRLVNLLIIREGVPRSARYAGITPRERVPRHVALRRQKAFAYFDQAQKLHQAGQTEAALAALRFACFLDAGNASYQVALGDTLLAAGNVRDAAAALAEAGRRYAAKKRYAEAIQQLNRALALTPLQVPARESLAEVYEEAGFVTLAARERQIAAMSRLKLATPATDWRRMHALARALTTPSLTLLSAVEGPYPNRRTPYRFTGYVRGNVYHDPALGLELHAPPGWQFVLTRGGETLELRNTKEPGYCTLQMLPTAGHVRLPELVASCQAGNYTVRLAEQRLQVSGLSAYHTTCSQIITGQAVSSRSLLTQQGNRVLMISLSTPSRRASWAQTAFRWLVSRLRLGKPAGADSR